MCFILNDDAETIRWNLDPFEEFSDQQIWDALEQANIKQVGNMRFFVYIDDIPQVISNLPERLSTTVAESERRNVNLTPVI